MSRKFEEIDWPVEILSDNPYDLKVKNIKDQYVPLIIIKFAEQFYIYANFCKNESYAKYIRDWLSGTDKKTQYSLNKCVFQEKVKEPKFIAKNELNEFLSRNDVEIDYECYDKLVGNKLENVLLEVLMQRYLDNDN